MKHSIVCGVLVRVQPQDVICADQLGGQVTIVLCDVKVPLGRSLSIGPEVPDHTSGVAVIGPGVQLQKVGDEHGGDIRHDSALIYVHILFKNTCELP